MVSKNPEGSSPEFVDYQVGADGYRDVASYDQERYIGKANEYRQAVMESMCMSLLGALQDKSILDVGCGTGRGIVAFAPLAKRAVGFDASMDMLRFTASKLSRQNKKNWSLARGYAQQLPFPSDSFDVVVTLNFLHLFSVETQRQMVAEMKRVTKPGGTIVLEFDNALHGLGFLGLYKRWFRKERGTLPWEARAVIGHDCRVAKVRTAVLPAIWRLLYRAPAISFHIEKITRLPGVGRIIGHRLYYQLKKPPQA